MNKPNQASVPASGAQHTAGPWKVVLDETSDDPIRIFQNDGTGNGDHIKLIAGNAESDANLRLIAAAPDLLAALKDAEDALAFILREGRSIRTSLHFGGMSFDALNQARAAILKAEGSQ